MPKKKPAQARKRAPLQPRKKTRSVADTLQPTPEGTWYEVSYVHLDDPLVEGVTAVTRHVYVRAETPEEAKAIAASKGPNRTILGVTVTDLEIPYASNEITVYDDEIIARHKEKLAEREIILHSPDAAAQVQALDDNLKEIVEAWTGEEPFSEHDFDALVAAPTPERAPVKDVPVCVLPEPVIPAPIPSDVSLVMALVACLALVVFIAFFEGPAIVRLINVSLLIPCVLYVNNRLRNR